MSHKSNRSAGQLSRFSNTNGAKITAPNGSIISSNSYRDNISLSSSKSGSNCKKSSIQGSIISHTKSATMNYRSTSGSVLSGVNSQVARRKKLKELSGNSSQSIKERAMSATSLNRRKSNDSESISTHLKRYSQSDVSVAIKSEIQSMTKDERNTLMSAIDKYKKQQLIEKNRKSAIQLKIREIQSLRPPYSEFQSNTCYICRTTFWPIIYVKYSCNRCRIFVCKNCYKQYNNNPICNQCFEEMIYLSKSDLLFKKLKDNDDSDDNDTIDVDTIKKMITQTDQNEDLNSYKYFPIEDKIEKSSRVSGASGASGSSVSLFKKLLNKKKEDSVSLSRSRSSLNLDIEDIESTKHDSASLRSMSIINSSAVLNLEEHGDSNVLREGEIMMGLSYNFNTEEFRIIIKKCRNLEIAIPNQKSSNPYIKVLLLPSIVSDKIYKTKTMSSNLNPEFNEQCKYKHIKYDDVIARTVLATVWHSERLGKDVFLGQVLLKLSDHPLDDATPHWYKLKDKSPATIHPMLSKYYGDVHFSIKYSVSGRSATSEDSQMEDVSNVSCTSGSIILWIKQANNLLTGSYKSLPNAYVKCLILPESSKVPAKKSQIIRKNFNPIWNITFPFNNIPLEELSKSGMEITVWDKKMGVLRDIFLGGVSLNISKNGRLVPNNEVEVWKKMEEKSETWIEAKLVLRKDFK